MLKDHFFTPPNIHCNAIAYCYCIDLLYIIITHKQYHQVAIMKYVFIYEAISCKTINLKFLLCSEVRSMDSRQINTTRNFYFKQLFFLNHNLSKIVFINAGNVGRLKNWKQENCLNRDSWKISYFHSMKV